MAIANHNREHIDQFFAAFAPMEQAYDNSFSYIAVRQGDEFHLIQGVLLMFPTPVQAPSGAFQSENIRAGRFRLADIGVTPRQFIEELFEARVRIPGGHLVLDLDSNGGLNSYFTPFAPWALQAQNRTALFSVTGGHQSPLMRQPNLDWELKAHPTPYENFQELMGEFQIGTLREQSVNIEVAAFNVAVVDQSSTIADEMATIRVQLSPNLDTSEAAFRYRIVRPDNSVDRGTIEGDKFTWSAEKGFQMGTATLPVPKNAYVQGTITYAGIGLNQRWIVDQKQEPNARRAAYEIQDKNFDKMREIIAREEFTRANARDIESVAAWLLWMFGFAPAHLNLPNYSDAPDVIAVTPQGHFAVVECTTGLLRPDDKLANLQLRTHALRRKLETSGNSTSRVLPVIVTTKRRADVLSDIEQAERHSVLVLTREDIESAIDRSRTAPNADQLFAEGEQKVKSNLAKYATSQQGIPGLA